MVRDELGRRRLMQWDINQRLIVDMPAGTQIHYASEAIGDKALVTIAYEENGLIYSNIPNILLQSPGTITVYVYPIKGEEAHTKSCATLVVLPRAKPEDYVYTETEVLSYRKLADEIGDLTELTTAAKENLVAAINEAAQNGGMLLVGLKSDMTADKTYSEIQTAVLNGKAVIVRYTTSVGYKYYTLDSFDYINHELYFFDISGDTHEVLRCSKSNYYWSITSAQFESKSYKVTALSASSSNEQYPSAKATYDAIQNASVVTVKITGSGTDSNPYVSSMTYDEIYSAMKADKTVVGVTHGPGNPTLFIAFESWSSSIVFARLVALGDGGALYERYSVRANGNVDHNVSMLETKGNKVTSLSASSTNAQYPSAKAVYDAIQAAKPDIVTPTAESTDTQAANAKAVWDSLPVLKTWTAADLEATT